jgi:hypothetical protein
MGGSSYPQMRSNCGWRWRGGEGDDGRGRGLHSYEAALDPIYALYIGENTLTSPARL